jgi:hypothetical protein
MLKKTISDMNSMTSPACETGGALTSKRSNSKNNIPKPNKSSTRYQDNNQGELKI